MEYPDAQLTINYPPGLDPVPKLAYILTAALRHFPMSHADQRAALDLARAELDGD